jgi:hypothetical protein
MDLVVENCKEVAFPPHLDSINYPNICFLLPFPTRVDEASKIGGQPWKLLFPLECYEKWLLVSQDGENIFETLTK